MTEAMPFLQKYDITFLRPPTIMRGGPFLLRRRGELLRGSPFLLRRRGELLRGNGSGCVGSAASGG